MILILTQCFPSRLGGIESLVSNLALGLSESEKVIVFADSHNIVYDAIFDNQYKKQIIVRRVGGLKFFRRRKKIKEIKPLIESNKVKLVIGDSWKSLELVINYLNIKKIPSVCLVHGNEILSEEVRKINRIKKTIEKTTLIIANSQYTLNLVKSLEIPNIQIDYIYPGALDLRKESIDESIMELPIIKGSPVILTLARIEKRKGHAYVIYSIKKLLNKYPNIIYLIAGEGKEKKNLEKLVIDNNLSKNIIFIGSVNEKQKKFLFEKTDLMVMPTIDESKKNSIEGFGISYIEAAFFSIPSIASNIGGTSEAVINNSTGIVIEKIELLHEAIIELLDNPEKKIKFGNIAKERALKDFSWKIVTKNHLSIYKKNNIL